MNNILLSDLDVIKFQLFMQHYDLFTTLLDSQALNQKSANIILCYDYLGTLQTIKREDVLYNKKFAKEK
jgi:hypothetical protein